MKRYYAVGKGLICVYLATHLLRFLREVVYSFSLCFQTGIQLNSIKRYLNKNIFV